MIQKASSQGMYTWFKDMAKVKVFINFGQGSRSRVNWKGFISWIYMQNMKSPSRTVQKLWWRFFPQSHRLDKNKMPPNYIQRHVHKILFNCWKIWPRNSRTFYSSVSTATYMWMNTLFLRYIIGMATDLCHLKSCFRGLSLQVVFQWPVIVSRVSVTSHRESFFWARRCKSSFGGPSY